MVRRVPGHQRTVKIIREMLNTSNLHIYSVSAADVKLAPHGGNLRSKINDGSVQLLRRSVSGNSAQDDVGSIGGDQQGLMSSSQHSSIDSQTRRDQTSEERQMTRSTGAIPNGTHKPPAANPWTNRSKGVNFHQLNALHNILESINTLQGESVEYEELSQDKTLSNDHEGEEEEFSEGQEDFKNPIIDGTGRPVDNNPDEDGFRGAQAIRRGTSGGHRGYRVRSHCSVEYLIGIFT